MIARVFAHADLPCRGRFLPVEGGEEVSCKVLHISRRKAVLDHHGALEPGAVLALDVTFPDGSSTPVMARISRAGEGGLFLEFQHEGDSAEARFGGRLIEASESYLVSEADRQRRAENALRSTILKRTRTVRSQDLANRSSEVRVVGMKAISGLIEEALAESLANSDRAFDAEERRRLLEETEATFQERLASLQAEKDGAVEQIGTLRAELERAERTLDEERARTIENDQFTVSEAGMDEIEERLGRLLERSLRQGDVDATTEEKMRAVFTQLLDDEREKIGERAREAQSEAIELLERKVGRLASTLEKSEKAREIAEHRAAALEAAGGSMGMKSVMDAGLHPDDPARERKLALLGEIVKENDTVREHIRRSKSGDAPPPATAPAEDGGGVKKITVKRVKPPPLTRTS